jgi:hypothetical protein
MEEPDYEYYGLVAATWDLFREILELGRPGFLPGTDPANRAACAGRGLRHRRLLLDYLAHGIDIDGWITRRICWACSKGKPRR